MVALADWKSATQQVGNLRYECDPRIRHRNYVGQQFGSRAAYSAFQDVAVKPLMGPARLRFSS